MSFYADSHRALQDEFGRRALADLLEAAIIHPALAPDEQAFIESQDMFFLSTVDECGRPTVSYKGGAPGFVRAPDPNTILFPCYDGNGMYYSLGNIEAAAHVGLLFIDFAVPHRLRIQGEASLVRDPDVLTAFPGAELVVRVTPTEIFVNCGRYIHKRIAAERSPYVPDAQGHAPVPAWKQIDFVQPVLDPAERDRVAASGGPITPEDYGQRVAAGRP
ncbi:MAG TPA: pyridoxamine 5'-phosphate oxidase family protein [Aliidongia sp.]|nr:pyridoxamine 5'-phosphate oxidase family protein [Aliidongia sp.]